MRNKIILIVSLITFLGCSQNQKKNIVAKESEPMERTYRFGDSEVNVIIRDTVFTNKNYKCLITYKILKDSLKSYINGKNFRNVFYSFRYTDTLVKDIKDVKNHLKDTIFSITDNSEMYTENLKFKKSGLNYVDGIIKDDIYLILPDSLNYRLISHEHRLNLKVFVIDSTSKVND